MQRRLFPLLGLGCLLAVAACSRGEAEAGAALPVGTEEGQRAPPLRGTTAAGELYHLDEESSAVVLVFYQGAYCGLCRERLQRLQEHLAAYGELGARVVAVTPDPPEQGAELARRLSLGFPIVSVDSATLVQWGVTERTRSGARPAAYLLAEGGEVLFRHVGRNAGDRVADAGLLTLLERRKRE